MSIQWSFSTREHRKKACTPATPEITRHERDSVVGRVNRIYPGDRLPAAVVRIANRVQVPNKIVNPVLL